MHSIILFYLQNEAFLCSCVLFISIESRNFSLRNLLKIDTFLIDVFFYLIEQMDLLRARCREMYPNDPLFCRFYTFLPQPPFSVEQMCADFNAYGLCVISANLTIQTNQTEQTKQMSKINYFISGCGKNCCQFFEMCTAVLEHISVMIPSFVIVADNSSE